MFLMFIPLLWTIIPLRISRCSEVIDGFDQKGIYISDYCPTMGSCPEGSHVMCMYYNPKRIMGHRCSSPQNISITPEIANKMLDIANAVRSKLARGKETGKDGHPLPKAYGMFKLKWDSELATFAQVLANQCVLRHDICRASKKFPSPGQAAGLVRFTNPLWRPVSPSVTFNETGITLPKINYATTQSVKSWYAHKDHVTDEMIANYPDWTLQAENLRGRLYLEMIFGEITHMGCGVSAYSELAYHDNKADLTYNSIQTICNFSAKPRNGEPVYQTTAPTEPGYTQRCGCPEGYEEDQDCLCSEIVLQTCGKNCAPNVVLLPIFTVEDAPRDILREDRHQEPFIVMPKMYRSNNNSKAVQENFDDIFGPYESYSRVNTRSNSSPIGPYIQPQTNNNDDVVKVLSEQRYSHNHYSRPMYDQHRIWDVKKRYFNKKNQNPLENHPAVQSLQPGYTHVQNRKSQIQMRPSIFTRSHVFHLPSETYALRPEIKRDVAPRKDFTQGKRVLNSYIHKKRRHEKISDKEFDLDSELDSKSKNTVEPRLYKIIETTEMYSKPKRENFNRYLKNKFHYQDFNVSHEPSNGLEVKYSNEEADTKLMTLLDTLEQEVKHIELDGNKKEIFDAKIKKIYDTVVKKTTDLKSPLHARTGLDLDQEDGYTKYVKYETDVKNHLEINHMDDRSKAVMDKRINKFESRVKDINSKLSDRYSDPKTIFLKKTKAHNSLLPYDDTSDLAVLRQYREPMKHNNYDMEVEDRNYQNNIDRNEIPDKSVLSYDDPNKITPDNDDLKTKNYRDVGEEGDLKTRENINNRNTDKIHNYDDCTISNRNDIDRNDLKTRIEDYNNYNYRDSEKRYRGDLKRESEKIFSDGLKKESEKQFNEDVKRNTEKRFKEDIKNDREKRYEEEIDSRHIFRQTGAELDLKNRDFDKTGDYRHTKKRSSDNNMKRNQLRLLIEDNSLKSRNLYRNNEGRIRHNYDEESMNRRNYNEQNANEFRSRMIDNGMRKIYKDYDNKDQETSLNDRLGLDRRKYYQEKLDAVERKLQSSRNYRRYNDREKERTLRLERPNRRDEFHLRPSSKAKNQYYIPERARILHGF